MGFQFFIPNKLTINGLDSNIFLYVIGSRLALTGLLLAIWGIFTGVFCIIKWRKKDSIHSVFLTIYCIFYVFASFCTLL